MRKDVGPVAELNAGDLSNCGDGGRRCTVIFAQVYFIHCVGTHDRGESANIQVARNDIEDVIPQLRYAHAGVCTCEPVDYGWPRSSTWKSSGNVVRILQFWRPARFSSNVSKGNW